MIPPDKDLLRAIPAPARRILVVGQELLRQSALWNARNPKAVIDTASGPWTAAPGETASPQFDAALLSLDELGGEAGGAARWVAARLATSGTLAIVAKSPADDLPLQSLAAELTQQGLQRERQIGKPTAGPTVILRFLPPGATAPKLCVTAQPIDTASGPLNRAVIRVRVQEPLDQLSSLPRVRAQTWSGKGGLNFERSDANILLVQRQLFFDSERYLKPFRASNFITIVEFDDLLLEGGFTVDLYRSNLRSFHAVQASTPALADFLRQFNPEVAVFGNQLARLRPRPSKPGPPVRLLFAAIGRREAWRQIVPACRKVLAEHADTVVATIVGDQEFFQELQAPGGRYRPVLDHADYLDELAKSDVALLPLADNPFDRCKSDLKFLECAEAGVAVLASHIVYGDAVEHGETGLIYRNEAEFGQHLRALIDDTPTRERLAANAHRHVSDRRMLAGQVQRQYEWYRSLLDRRDELNRRIQQRVGSP